MNIVQIRFVLIIVFALLLVAVCLMFMLLHVIAISKQVDHLSACVSRYIEAVRELRGETIQRNNALNGRSDALSKRCDLLSNRIDLLTDDTK